MKLNKIYTILLITFFITFFNSCQKEDSIIVVEEKSTEFSIQTIKFNELKNNQQSFIVGLNESQRQIQNVLNRNENTIIVDTTSAYYISVDDINTYTFSIIDDLEIPAMRNLLIFESEDGNSNYFLVEYTLDVPASSVNEANIESHIINTETSIIDDSFNILYASDINNTQSRSGSCWDVSTSTVNYCDDANGNTQVDNGQLGNGCHQNWRTVTFTTINIDLDCLEQNSGLPFTGGGTGGSSNNGPGGPSPGNGSGGTPITTTPTFLDGSSAVSGFLISKLGAENLNTTQTTWINNSSNLSVVQYFLNFIINNDSSIESKDLVLDIINSEINGTLITALPFFKYPDGSNYASTYPELTILLKEYIPYLQSNVKLINTISRLTGISTEEIQDDFTWNEGPEIHIEQLGIVDGEEIKGKFSRLEPNKIIIDIDLVNTLEALAAIENPSQAQIQQLQLLDGLVTFAVCLHEYVHFADFAFDGEMQDNEDLELGLLFEELFVGGFYEIDPNGNVILIPTN